MGTLMKLVDKPAPYNGDYKWPMRNLCDIIYVKYRILVVKLPKDKSSPRLFHTLEQYETG